MSIFKAKNIKELVSTEHVLTEKDIDRTLMDAEHLSKMNKYMDGSGAACCDGCYVSALCCEECGQLDEWCDNDKCACHTVVST